MTTGEVASLWRVVWLDGGVHRLQAHARVPFGDAGKAQRMLGVNMGP
jgi:hypothetical protein